MNVTHNSTGAPIYAEHRGYSDVRLASFDDAVLKAHAALHPN